MSLLLLLPILILQGVGSLSFSEDQLQDYQQVVTADDAEQYHNLKGSTRSETKCAVPSYLHWKELPSVDSSVKEYKFHITAIPIAHAKSTTFQIADFKNCEISLTRYSEIKKIEFYFRSDSAQKPYWIQKGEETEAVQYSSGSLYSRLSYDWQAGVPLKFVVTFKALDTQSAWSVRVDVTIEKFKFHMGTIGRRDFPASEWLSNIYSFIKENNCPAEFGGYKDRRSIKFTDIYATIDGKRHDIKKAYFEKREHSVSAGKHLAMAGTAEKQFYLGTGGQTTNPQQIFEPTPKLEYHCQNNKCYGYSKQVLSYEGALRLCKLANGTLPIIDNSAKQQLFLAAADKFADCKRAKFAWIGLNDKAKEGSPVWEDGRSLASSNYDKRHSGDTGHDTEDCYVGGVRPGDYWYNSWSDTKCYKTAFCTLCEVPNSKQRSEDLFLEEEDNDATMDDLPFNHLTLGTDQNRGDSAKIAARAYLSYKPSIPLDTNERRVRFTISMRPVMSAPSTYFGAIVIPGALLGISQTKTGERFAIASVTNGPKGLARATADIPTKGVKVTDNRPHGLKIAYPLDWKLDWEMVFYLQQDLDGSDGYGNVITAKLKLPNGEWIKMGSYTRPGHVMTNDIYSVIADDDYSTGATGWTKRRSAMFRNGKARHAYQWYTVNVNKARFLRRTDGADAYSHHYATSGISDGYFHLGTGGKTDRTATFTI